MNDDYNFKYSKINKAGFYIHKFLHNSKAKPGAILYTHSLNGVAISCLKEGFNEKLNQSSMRFFKRIKYFDYDGMVVDNNVAKNLCSQIDINKKIIILKNHGIIIIARDIEELFHLTFHFEKCCEIQLKLSNNKELNKIGDKVAKLACDQNENFRKVGHMSWKASLRMLRKNFK